MIMARYPMAKVLLIAIAMTSLTIIDADTHCLRAIPGSDKMVKGVDITSLDMLPSAHSVDSNGIRYPVLSYTCNFENKWQSPSGVIYDRPDQVWHITSDPAGWKTTDSKLYKTTEDVRESLNVQSGIKGTLKKFSFSASVSYTDTENLIYNTSSFVQDIESYESSKTIDLYPHEELKLDRICKKYIDEKMTGTFDDNPEAYRKFIQDYGTHYFQKGRLGGLVKVRQVIDKYYVYSKKAKEISVSGKASLNKALSLRGGVVSGSQVVSSSFKEASSQRVMYYGGNTNLLNNGILTWQPTVDNDPWLFSGELRPISDLITNNSKKANLEKAVLDHVLGRYLDDLLRLVEMTERKFKPDSRLSNLKSRIAAMKREQMLQTENVETLGNDVRGQITAPSWFKDVKTCAYCDNSNKVCTPINSRNVDDDNCFRVGYGLLALHEIPRWFQNVNLCITFFPSTFPNSHACIKADDVGVRRCGRVNSIAAFGDGAAVSWEGGSYPYCKTDYTMELVKTDVGTEKPVWFEKFKICHFLESDRNGRDCGNASDRTQCFNTGELMTVRNPDGCPVSWGIFTIF